MQLSLSYLLCFYAEMKKVGCVLLKVTNSPISTSEIKDTSIEVDPVYEGILGINLIENILDFRGREWGIL